MLRNPIYGKESTERTDRLLDAKLPRYSETRTKVKTHAFVGQEEQRKSITCIFCERSHHLDECEELKARPEKERTDIVKKRSLCFGWLRGGI